MKNSKKSILSNPGFQTLLASLVCIVVGLLIGYIVLLIINPAKATEGIVTILKNFLTYGSGKAAMKYFGNTLVKTAPLLMCALSVQFCYSAGLFNIGAAGQYVAGAGLCLYAALVWKMPWPVCLILSMVAGAAFGAVVGVLKAYRNVNEVISGIMLNWIGLYTVNMALTPVKETASPNKYVTIAIPLAILIAVLIWVVLNKTVFGYELRATGLNKEAAKYSGMKEKTNTILTLAIGGALAGLGASFLFLSGFEQWSVTQSSVPTMGFNGIAATFLGGLHPIGTIFSSYFIQHITSGGSYLHKAVFPAQISDLISAIIIYLCGFVAFFRLFINTRIVKSSKNTSNSNDVPISTPAAGDNKKGGDEK